MKTSHHKGNEASRKGRDEALIKRNGKGLTKKSQEKEKTFGFIFLSPGY
jgi:hypothetical protein